MFRLFASSPSRHRACLLAGGLSAGLPLLLSAQLHNDGSALVFEADTVMTVDGSVENGSGGSIDLPGALIIGGDLINRGSFDASGSGELLFNGESAQTVAGLEQTSVAIFTAAGPGHVVLGSPLDVSGEFWLDGGTVDLGDHDLTLLPGAVIQGNPSVLSMVATTGEGVLALPVSSLGAYFFPIGTLANGPAFTPVEVILIDADLSGSPYIFGRVAPESRSINPSRNNFINRAWFLTGSEGLALRDASATFVWDDSDEFGDVGDLYGGLFAESQLFLLESVDPLNRQFTARVGRLGAFTAGEPRAFEDDVLDEGDPVDLQLPPSLSSEGGSIDLAGAYGNIPGFSFALGAVSDPALFSRLQIVDGQLQVQIADGRTGESSVVLLVTNEYGVTREEVVYVTEQPDPRLVRSALNELTGYFEQDYVLENISAVRPLDVLDVIVSQLPATASLARATLVSTGGELKLSTAGSGVRVRTQRLLLPGEALSLRLEYASSTRQAPSGVEVGYGDYGLYAAAMMDRGWMKMAPLGWFYPESSRWSFHYGWGWLWTGATSTDNAPIYLHGYGWVWTSAAHFPFLYSYVSGSWLYYQPDTAGPAWFFDYATREWFSR